MTIAVDWDIKQAIKRNNVHVLPCFGVKDKLKINKTTLPGSLK